MTRPCVSLKSSVAPCEQLGVLAGDHHLQAVVRTHLVGERGGEELLEPELVAEVLAGSGRDLDAQTELVGVGFLVAQLLQLGERRVGDLDDQFARHRRAREIFQRTHAFTIPAPACHPVAHPGPCGPILELPEGCIPWLAALQHCSTTSRHRQVGRGSSIDDVGRPPDGRVEGRSLADTGDTTCAC